MQDVTETGGQSNEPKSGNKNPFKTVPTTWRIVGVALLGVVVLAAVARCLPDMKERLKFFTDTAFAWLVFVVVLVQSYIYNRQTQIMGVTYDPRLQITNVKVANLKAEEEPIFMISIKNIGANDAVGVVFNLRVSFGRPVEGTLAQKLKEPQTITIPSGQEHTYVIPWSDPIKQEHLNRLPKVPLIVSGFIKLRGEAEKPFCYRYYALKGERPLGVPEFVPCDFDTRLTHVVTPGTARLKLTTFAPELVTRPAPPKEAEIEDKTDSKNENEGENPS